MLGSSRSSPAACARNCSARSCSGVSSGISAARRRRHRAEHRVRAGASCKGWDAAIATGALGAFWAIVYLRRRSSVAPIDQSRGLQCARGAASGPRRAREAERDIRAHAQIAAAIALTGHCVHAQSTAARWRARPPLPRRLSRIPSRVNSLGMLFVILPRLVFGDLHRRAEALRDVRPDAQRVARELLQTGPRRGPWMAASGRAGTRPHLSSTPPPRLDAAVRRLRRREIARPRSSMS